MIFLLSSHPEKKMLEYLDPVTLCKKKSIFYRYFTERQWLATWHNYQMDKLREISLRYFNSLQEDEKPLE
jgi:hypothetical protein